VELHNKFKGFLFSFAILTLEKFYRTENSYETVSMLCYTQQQYHRLVMRTYTEKQTMLNTCFPCGNSLTGRQKF